MNEELIRQCAAEVAYPDTGELAIRLYHARHVAPLVEALIGSRIYVVDSLEAHEHSDGRELLARIDAALAPFQQEAK